jgi:hypothetical protein
MDRPTASPARFPYSEHRTMAQVMADERTTAYALSWHEAFARKCPRCRALPNKRCRDPSGRTIAVIHDARRSA